MMIPVFFLFCLSSVCLRARSLHLLPVLLAALLLALARAVCVAGHLVHGPAAVVLFTCGHSSQGEGPSVGDSK